MEPSLADAGVVVPRRPELRVWRDALTAVLLGGITFAVFAPALSCKFVNLDDPYYVTRNPHVTAGLSAGGTRWAFTTFEFFNWHPLTWLSLQLDATLWHGPDPQGFHLTNVLLHAANAALAFLALRGLTGAFWRSLAAALLFAVHPLRVESVAWVAERKDVLSVCFGLLALWAYAHYARAPSAWRYLPVAGLFALSLMAKPMLVTLPFLLLVLDWWPLRRLSPSLRVGEGRGEGDGRQDLPAALSLPRKRRGNRAWTTMARVGEKAPLLVLAAVASVLTYQAQSEQGAVVGLEAVPFGARVGGALVNYVTYLGQTFWPAGLTPLYPRQGARLPVWHAAAAALCLAALTAGAVVLRRRSPYLLAGWLWFLGTLVPVVGLVQFGTQDRADRFTYFPQIGVLLALCWGAADIARGRARPALVAAAAAAALALAVRTENQLVNWHDSITLWQHALRVTSANCQGEVYLGNAYEERGEPAEALRCYREAVRADPDSAPARSYYGNALLRQERFAEAGREYEAAVRLQPDSAAAHLNLGKAYLRQGQWDEAARQFDVARAVAPRLGEPVFYRGLVEEARGNLAAAEGLFRETLKLQPDHSSARVRLAMLLARTGRRDGDGGPPDAGARRAPGARDRPVSSGAEAGGPGQVP